jgi:hypothetical protein
VICLRAIITSRGRPLPVSSQHVGLKRERLIQRFPKDMMLPERRFHHNERTPGLFALETLGRNLRNDYGSDCPRQ